MGAHRVGDAIGADLLGVVVENRHPGADARSEHDRLHVQVAVAETAQLEGHVRHARGDRDAGYVVDGIEVACLQQLAQQQPQLVAGAVRMGGQPPVVEQFVAPRAGVVEAHDRLGVANIDHEQQGGSKVFEGCTSGCAPNRLQHGRSKPEVHSSAPARSPCQGPPMGHEDEGGQEAALVSVVSNEQAGMLRLKPAKHPSRCQAGSLLAGVLRQVERHVEHRRGVGHRTHRDLIDTCGGVCGDRVEGHTT